MIYIYGGNVESSSEFCEWGSRCCGVSAKARKEELSESSVQMQIFEASRCKFELVLRFVRNSVSSNSSNTSSVS